MKKILLALFAISYSLSAIAFAQVSAVKKNSNTNALTEDLVLPTGRTLELQSGSSLTLAGAVSGTPTSGTLSLANLTLTLPSGAARANLTGGSGTLDLSSYTLTLPSGFATDAEVAAGYQPLDSDLTAIAGLTTTSYGRGLLELADSAAGRTSLGLAAVASSASASDISTGTLADARLSTKAQAIPALTWSANKIAYFTGSSTAATTDLSAYMRGLLSTADNLNLRNGVGLPTIDTGQFYSAARATGMRTGNTPSPLRVIVLGDSLSSGIRLGPLMAYQGGTVGMISSTGGATYTSGSTSTWFNGKWYDLPSGSTAIFSGDTEDVVANRAQILYIKESGAGTLTLDQSTNSGSSWTTGVASWSASNASTIGASQIVTLSNSNYPRTRIRLNATGGAVKVVGVILYNEGAVGSILIQNLFNGVGYDVVQGLDCPDAVLSPIWQALAPDIAVSCWADIYTEWQEGGSFVTVYNKLKGWRSATDWIHIAPPPSGYAPDISSYSRENSALAYWTFARANGDSFYDGFSLFRSQALASAAGLYSDTVHLTESGDDMRNISMWSSMSIGRWPMGRLPINNPRPTSGKSLPADGREITVMPGAYGGSVAGAWAIISSRLVSRAGNMSGFTWHDRNETYAWKDDEAWSIEANNRIGYLIGRGNTVFSFDTGSAQLTTSLYQIKAPAFQISSTTTAQNITADNSAIVIAERSFIRLTSNSTTATDRTFTLPNGSQGQVLVLKWADATNRGELANSGNCVLSATWSPDENDTLTLIWDSAATKWTEMARSAN